MPEQSHYTIGEISRLYHQPGHRIRTIVDELPAEIPRAGRYRLVPRELLAEVAARLRDRGWLPQQKKTPA